MVPPLRQGDGVFPPLSQRGRVRVGANARHNPMNAIMVQPE